jgi:hypothetical protein
MLGVKKAFGMDIFRLYTCGGHDGLLQRVAL